MGTGRLFQAECQRDILLLGLFRGRFRSSVGKVPHPVSGRPRGGIDIAHLEAPGAVSRLRALQINPYGIVKYGHGIAHEEIAGKNTERVFLPVCDDDRIRQGQVALYVKGHRQRRRCRIRILPELVYRPVIRMLRLQLCPIRHDNRVIDHRNRTGSSGFHGAFRILYRCIVRSPDRRGLDGDRGLRRSLQCFDGACPGYGSGRIVSRRFLEIHDFHRRFV